MKDPIIRACAGTSSASSTAMPPYPVEEGLKEKRVVASTFLLLKPYA